MTIKTILQKSKSFTSGISWFDRRLFVSRVRNNTIYSNNIANFIFIQSWDRISCYFQILLHADWTFHVLCLCFLVPQTTKNLPAVWETWVWFLGREEPLEKGMATHFSILAWGIPSPEEPGTLESWGSQRVIHNWATYTRTQNYTHVYTPHLLYPFIYWWTLQSLTYLSYSK